MDDLARRRCFAVHTQICKETWEVQGGLLYHTPAA